MLGQKEVSLCFFQDCETKSHHVKPYLYEPAEYIYFKPYK